MQMRGFRPARGNGVYIDIEKFLAHKLQRIEPGFFVRFAHGAIGWCRIGVIEMPTGLQPPIQFCVMQQQRMRARKIQHPCR